MPTQEPDGARGAADEQWRDVLRGLVAPGDEPPAERARGLGLALQFELRELTPHTRERWNGPTSRTVGGRGQELVGRGEYRLGVRPVVRAARGWTRGSVTWSNIAQLRGRLDLDADQHRWFCQFGALHRAAGPALPDGDLAWVYLDEFVNPVLWDLLAQARAIGIVFVGSGAGATVRVADGAHLGLDAARSAQGIRVSARLTVDGVPVEVRDGHAIGTHGIYVVDLARPRQVVLAPTHAPLGAPQLTLLGARGGRTATDALRDTLGEGVLVPADHAQDFLREHVPVLRAAVDVESADGTVDLPAPAPPTLVLTARHGPRHTVDLAWHWDGHARSGPTPLPRAVLPDGSLPGSWWPDGDGLDLPLPVTLHDLEAAEFVATTVPRLAALPGVRVDTVGTAPLYRELTGTPVLTVTAQPTETNDWFDLGVTVTVDGRTIPFAPLFRALTKKRTKLLLVDGSYLALTHPALGPLAALIAEATELTEWRTGPRISRHQTALWADLVDLADEAVAAPQWRDLLAEAGDQTPHATPLPRGLNADLRPYQVEGFGWLAFLWRHQVGGILADDMGLGKTLQCLALIAHVAEQRAPGEPRRPFLVVAPTSVGPNWVAETARFAPGLTVRRLSSTDAASATSVAEAAAGADIVVTSYALLRLDFDAYQAIAQSTGWAGLILDEAQNVKNASSRVHECARDLEVRFTLAVTGTPMENSLTELHALFSIVTPGLLASVRSFGEQYVRPIEGVRAGITTGRGAGDAPADSAQVRAVSLDRLRRRIRPFMVRRTRDLVAADLPDKQEQTLTVELDPDHRRLYDLYLQRERQKVLGLVDDLDRQRFIVYRSLTLLRMLALDASLIDPEHAGLPSSKLDALLEQLDEVVAEGHRALVFSQFTSYLTLAADRLTAAGVPFAYLDGSTVRRAEVIDEFRTGTAPVFLISLKAGGTGLNLTEADYVFLLDPWWNPATEQQAIARSHRIGQRRNVMVYRLIAADTIEEKVMALQARKAALVDAVIDDGDLFGSALTADEVRELLG
ncbi:DEAD/DEAH box helicase [Pengzhenrongella phosphoraccumulans]|uniref:DEAD/DEAH box helicase n=1 Tax=Pengzhenrongella phosphoraccumulans TaxID=3114394 RepID=UPI0038908422